MIKEAFGIADTVEEAKEAAIAELDAALDADVSFEIIDMPKKKVLGIFGGTKAKVRAYIEIAEKEKKNKKPQKKNDKPRAKKEEVKGNQPKAAKTEKVEKNEPVYSEAVDSGEIDKNSPAGKAVAYLLTVLEGLGCSEISAKVALREGGARISLVGEGLGACIGHRGETLDALQYLCSMVASVGGYYRISLDVGNYREKRERTLTSLANRISAQVIRTGRSRSLEPMNPYERRIIHTAVQEIEGVVSNSVGEGSRRHVVISPEGKEGYRNDRREKQTISAPTREPRSDSDNLPLYGKIK